MRRTVILLSLLAACGTPQERCIQGVTRDLRVVDRLIATSEGNLKRGYALEEVVITSTEWVPCAVAPAGMSPEGTEPPAPALQLCPTRIRDTEVRPKAINLKNEAETLDSLRIKRKALLRDANAGITQCKAEFPES